jgi:hypothetical protein
LHLTKPFARTPTHFEEEKPASPPTRQLQFHAKQRKTFTLSGTISSYKIGWDLSLELGFALPNSLPKSDP